RGYRIELGEIEAALEQVSSIKKSVVLAREDSSGNKQLVAYVVTEKDFEQKIVQQELLAKIPEYMVPKLYVSLAEFPLTSNGKIDKKNLPSPATDDYKTANYVAPSTEIEKQLVAIWEEQLELPQIGIYDDFFELGGDSIKIIRLISMLNKQFDTKVELAKFYQNPTITNLATLVQGEDKALEESTSARLIIEKELEDIALAVRNSYPEKEDIENAYPMSDIQVGMVLTSEMMRADGEIGIYHDQMVSQVGALHIPIMEKALNLLVEKHEILRTSFHLYGFSQPVQIVHKPSHKSILIEDISEKTKEDREQYIKDFLANERAENPFDVTKAPLWRIHIFQINASDSVFIFQFHHAIIDGWSDKSFRSELMQTYLELQKNENYTPSKLAIGLKESVISDLLELKNEENSTYWKEKLQDYKRLDILSNERHYHETGIIYRQEFYEKIVTQCKKDHIAPKSLFFAGYLYTLSLFSLEKDITVGTVSHRRPIAEDGDKLLGCFLNTVPFRFKTETIGNDSWLAYIRQVETALQQLKGKDRFSLLEISKLHNESSQNNPFFDVMFNYVDFHVIENLMESEAFEAHADQKETTELAVGDFERTNTFLDITVSLTGNELTVSASQTKKLKSGHSLEDVVEYLHNFLNNYLENATAIVDSRAILLATEKVHLLETFNNTAVSYETGKTVLDMFANQVAKNPDATAIIFEETTLSYQELADKSNQLANFIQKQNVSAESLIPLCIERSVEMLIGIFAVLKAGHAYVPIDPTNPQTRIDFILKDIAAELILTESSLEKLFSDTTQKVISLDVVSLENESSKFETNVKDDQLAYIIYTSGTTGIPKGVMIEHKSLFNFLNGFSELYNFSAAARIGFKTNYAFDVSVHELFGWINEGGSVVVFPTNAEKEATSIIEQIQKHKITHLNLVPSLFAVLLEELQYAEKETLSSLEYFFLAGEALPVQLVKDYHKLGFETKLENIYGPTEATIYSSYYSTENLTDDQISVPIGKPTINTELYVLDNQLSLVPIGVIGELCISGKGLSKGYLNQEALTAEKFVDHPFRKGEKLYKTGDLAKWLPDGNIAYIGRKDDQVKIRGYRIELGEIETALDQLETIKQSVVVAKEDETGSKQLVGYFTSETEIDFSEIQEQLATQLPNYMIPNRFMRLDEFPLNANGKINKKALPALDQIAVQKAEYVAPTTETEKQLVAIWENVLGIPKIGIHDNFFQLGGDSIKAIQLVSRSKMVAIHYQVRDIFTHQTIAQIAVHVKEASTLIQETGILEGEAILHPIQEQFFAKENEAFNHYNQSVLVTVSKIVTEAHLAEAIQLLSKQHDALRFQYQLDEKVTQMYGNQTLELQVETAETVEEISNICANAQTTLDIEKGDIARFVWIKTPSSETENRVFIAIHHIAVDGVSWRILLEDLTKILENQQQGIAVTLPEKGTSYRQWTNALKTYATSSTLEKEANYWKQVLEQHTSLPTDTTYDEAITFEETKNYSVSLDASATKSLLHEVHTAYGTEINDILLSALAMALQSWMQAPKVVIGLEGHGREELFDNIDINRTIGWFTSVYPVCLDLLNTADIGILVADTKDMLREIPNKGIGYGALRYLSENEHINMDLSVDYEDIIFNYLGSFDNSVSSEKESIVGFAKENAGETMSPKNKYAHKFSINSMIVEGSLQLDWDYDAKRYQEETIKQLADNYIQALQAIIAHCKTTEVPVKTVSDYKLPATIGNSELATFMTAKKHQSSIEDVYPLSPLQEGFLFHSLYDEDTSSYIIQFQCDIISSFSIVSFQKTWEHLMAQHTILRTAIFTEDLAIPVQCVYKEVAPPITHVDYSNLSGEALESAVETFIENDRTAGFVLENAPLFRIALLNIGNNRTRMVFTNHHMLWDGWSLSRLMSSFMSSYAQLEANGTLPVLPFDNYGAHIRHISGMNEIQGENYWKKYLANITSPSYLPFINDTAKRNKIFGNTEHDFTFSGDIQAFTEKHHITMNTLIQGAWSYLLSKYTNQETVVFGATISGRDSGIENVEDKVGLYINTIPVSTTVKSDTNITDWLQELQKEHTIGRESYGFMSLNTIEAQSDSSGSLFDSIVVFENYPAEEISSESSSKFMIENAKGVERNNYSLSLSVFPATEGITIRFGYNNTVIADETIAMIKGHLHTVLQSFLNDVATIGAIEYVQEAEKKQILTDFSTIKASYPREENVVSLFEAQVEKTPNAIAVCYADVQLTYNELNTKANQVAHYLKESYNITNNDFIGIMMKRSDWMLVSILGILKSGAAYVPIDSNYPMSRKSFMVQDTNIKALLITSEDVFEAMELNVSLCSVDIEYNTMVTDMPHTENIKIDRKPSDSAYAIYTSGTSGIAKGSLITHEAIVRLAHMTQLPLNDATRILQMASISFDAATFEIWCALLNGGEVIVYPHDEVDLELINDTIQKYNVNTTWFTSGLLDQWVESDIAALPLQYMLCGGDVLTPSSISLLYEKLPEITIINGYGPTENTTFTACYRIPKHAETYKSIPIGYPITGTSIYILDDNLDIVPMGVAGELCTGGAGLSKGYLNQPELTQEKFIDNPFQKGSKLYKTGDLVKWLPNGSIAFIGRKDNQVKIRGYRVELGEIETALEQIEEVKQSVVLALDDEQGGKQLVAYTVSDVTVESKYLQTQLEANLPEYMIPKAYINLTQFPLTTNGKVDKKALPAPSVEAYQTKAYKAPTTEQEIQLTEIWQDLLGIEQIGTEDNFFELGGDSIKAIQLVSRSKSAGLFYSVKDIFQYQTISEIAKQLKEADTVIQESGVLAEEVPLHPIQKQFFAHDYVEFNHYNQAVLLTIPKTITQPTLETAVAKICKHHDALRFNYTKVETSHDPVQTYGTHETTLQVEMISDVAEITSVCSKHQASLDIYEGDIARFVWMQTPENEEKDRIFIAIHHLAVDGVSWRIILEDFQNLIENEHTSLPAKGTSYRQWTTELQKYADQIATTGEHNYWKKVLANYKTLPVDVPYTEKITNNETESYSIAIAKEKTQTLLQEVNSAYGTAINDVLLTALAVALQEYVTGKSLVIAMEGHGREELFDGVDINRTVGWFTSMYPVCLQLNTADNIGTLLADIKDMLRRIPTKGIGYGALRYSASDSDVREELNVAYEDVIFNYLGSFDNSVSDEKEGFISFADEASGETTGSNNANPHKLSINSMVVKGELQLDWNYDAKRYHEATIKEFATRYLDAIDEIITHCTTVKAKTKTAHDFGLPTEISNTELIEFKKLEVHPYEIEDIYPLSPLQEGLLFHSLYNNNTAAYIVQFQCDIVGEFSSTSFEKAWKHLMEMHTILRTGIHTENISIPVQCVYKDVAVPITTLDYCELTADAQATALETFIHEDRNIGFNLQNAPLFRITLINIGNGRTKMIFTNHHMLWDGWSLSRLMENFMETYAQFEENGIVPSAVVDNYGSHIRHIISKDEGRGKAYWKSYLANITEPSYLPFIKDVSKRNKQFGNTEREFVLTADLNKKIYAFAEQQRITVNTLLQASWAYLLSKYTQQNEVVFGATISGRDSDVEGIDDKIGLYINTIPVASTIDGAENITTWLQNLQKEHTEAREEYAYLPLSTVERQSNIKSSLFDSLVVFENYPVEEIAADTETSERSGFGLEDVKGTESTNYALSLIILPAKEGLTIRFGFNNTLISETTIAMIELHIEQLLESFLTANTISDLQYITEKESAELLNKFNNTSVEYTTDETLISLFSQQVAERGNATALVFEEEKLSYQQLDARSNQVANYIVSKGVKANDFVPICAERSLEMYIGILGILKAGAAYVPIDTNNPVERIEFIINDINAEVVLTSSTQAELFNTIEKEILCLDQLEGKQLSSEAVAVTIVPSQLAYAIYTSGTTGLPKGVKNAHSGLLNRLLWMRDDVNITEKSVLLQKTPYVFDVSVWELLMPLITGCQLVIAKPEGHKDPVYLQNTIEKHHVSLVHFVPSMLAVFVETVEAEKCSSLQNIICSGEALPVQLVKDFKATFTNTSIHNYYGPTEAAIDVTAINLTNSDYEVTIPIGKPVANTNIYIVGEDMQLSPIGVSGEILIGGVQVSEGYINREALTKDKFIESPFKKGERVYKTGDIARWLPDGNIAYIGRKDDQIKLRGYRIELGEIT
ncbi:non-ribosomal peptide synthetase, partial [Kordia jejudonensis]|uniref:non-ribosomal peptide synthetase n=1 Tax=Kordia jejudonensis TaxID=1348245 RepID=UPI000629CAD0